MGNSSSRAAGAPGSFPAHPHPGRVRLGQEWEKPLKLPKTWQIEFERVLPATPWHPRTIAGHMAGGRDSISHLRNFIEERVAEILILNC